MNLSLADTIAREKSRLDLAGSLRNSLQAGELVSRLGTVANRKAQDFADNFDRLTAYGSAGRQD